MSPRKLTKRHPTRRTIGRIILVLGGASSGKSEAALQLAGASKPRAFVATGQALDDEMAARIARHQAGRPQNWDTVEEPIDVEAWFAQQGSQYRTILFDCVTLWVSNLVGIGFDERTILARTGSVLHAMRTAASRVIIVSNELGLGLVPTEPHTRAFRDVAGRVNQQIAAEADEVYLVISGLPLRLK